MLGVSYVMTFYVDACALVYFQFHPRSVCRSVDPGTTSRHFGAETKREPYNLEEVGTGLALT